MQSRNAGVEVVRGVEIAAVEVDRFVSLGVAMIVAAGDGADGEVNAGGICVNSRGTATGSGGAAQAGSKSRSTKTRRMDEIIREFLPAAIIKKIPNCCFWC